MDKPNTRRVNYHRYLRFSAEIPVVVYQPCNSYKKLNDLFLLQVTVVLRNNGDFVGVELDTEGGHTEIEGDLKRCVFVSYIYLKNTFYFCLLCVISLVCSTPMTLLHVFQLSGQLPIS